MKKFYSLMLVAVAAMAFTACSQDDMQEVVKPEGATKTITVTAEAETRVTLNDDHTKMQWVEGDVFSLFTDADANQQLTYAGGSTNFELTVSEDAAEVYAYYPYYETNTDAGDVSLYVTSSQDQAVAGVLQGTNNSGSGQYPMVASVAAIENNSVALSFRPVACAFAFNIYGEVAEGEQIVSVSFTPADEQVVAGAEKVDLTNIAADYEYTAANGYATTATVTLGTPFTPDTTKPADTQAYNKQVYLTVAAKAYVGGEFVVTTTETTYTFTTASTLDCRGKDFFLMNLNLAKGEKPVVGGSATFVHITDAAQLNTTNTYVMAANLKSAYSDSATWYVWNGEFQSTNERFTTVEYSLITGTDGFEVENVLDVATFKLEDAGEGKFYIKTDAGYLYSTVAKKCYIGETKTAWEIVAAGSNPEEDGFSLICEATSIWSNGTSADTAIRAYAASSAFRGLHFFTDGEIVVPPTITVDSDELTFVGEDAADQTVNVELLGGLTDYTVTEDADWLTVTKSGNVLTFSVTNNETGAERNATVTLSADGATSVPITVSQEKIVAAGSGEDIEVSFVTSSVSCNQYTETWTQTSGDYQWTIVNFSNNNNGWGDIRCGRKSATSVASIATKFAIPWAVSEVVVTVSTVRKTDKLNSAKLQLATDGAFSNIVETVTVEPSSYNATGNVTYTITAPTANCYYRLVYDMPSSGQNGHIGISNILYVAQ